MLLVLASLNFHRSRSTALQHPVVRVLSASIRQRAKAMRTIQGALRRGLKWALGRERWLPEILNSGAAVIPEPAALPSWMHEQVASELEFFREGITPARLATAEQFRVQGFHHEHAHYSVRAGKLHCLTSSQNFAAYIAERSGP